MRISTYTSHLIFTRFSRGGNISSTERKKMIILGDNLEKKRGYNCIGSKFKKTPTTVNGMFHILIANQRVNEYPRIHFLSRHLGKITNLLQTRLPALQFPHFQMTSQADTCVVKRTVTREFVIWVQTAEIKMSFSRQRCACLDSFLMIPGTCSSYTQFSD